MSIKKIIFCLVCTYFFANKGFAQKSNDLELLKQTEKWLFETMLEKKEINKSTAGYLIFIRKGDTCFVDMLTLTDETRKLFTSNRQQLLANTENYIKDTTVIPFFVLTTKDNGCINFYDEFPNKLTTNLDLLSIRARSFIRPLIVGLSIPRR